MGFRRGHGAVQAVLGTWRQPSLDRVRFCEHPVLGAGAGAGAGAGGLAAAGAGAGAGAAAGAGAGARAGAAGRAGL